MKHGLRILGLVVAVCALAGGIAGSAQAYVYWTNVGPGIDNDGTTIGRANQNASGLTHSLITGLSVPDGIAVDAGHIYWSNSQTNSIGRANLDGTGADPTFIPHAVDSSNGGGVIPIAVATDGNFVYWTDGARYIGRGPLAGGSATPHFIDAGPGSDPEGIAVSAGTIYIGEFDSILTVPAVGGASPTVLKLLTGTPEAITVANGFIYMADLNLAGSSIARLQTNGAGLDESFIPNVTLPTGVATDGTFIYWVDHGGSQNAIGRALLGTNGASNVQPSFIPEPAGPWGIAVDNGIDSTRTSVSCIPPSVTPGNPTSCAATVADSASSAPPSGTVVFSSDATTFFSGSSSSCTLAARADGTVGCTIGVVPTVAGTTPVHAAYSGDPVHSTSSTDFAICTGTALQCGTSTPTPTPTPSPQPTPSPKPQPHCAVPRLKGKTLASARTLLSKAHCTLGKVTRPRARKGHKLGRLLVGSQSPQPGRTIAAGSKVAIRLIAAPKPRRRR